MSAHRPRVLWAGGQPRSICKCCWWQVVPAHGQTVELSTPIAKPRGRAA